MMKKKEASSEVKIANKYVIKQLALGFSKISRGALATETCAECGIDFSTIPDEYMSLAVVEGSVNKKMCTPCGIKLTQQGANLVRNNLPPEKQRSLRLPNILKDL
jgi:predicted  nucleic acid-binding Zn-ribbon protein